MLTTVGRVCRGHASKTAPGKIHGIAFDGNAIDRVTVDRRAGQDRRPELG